jgi:hypothetical protein
MGEYRFSMYFVWQIGFTIGFNCYRQIEVNLPFISILIATSKWAKGVRIFNKHINFKKQK